MVALPSELPGGEQLQLYRSPAVLGSPKFCGSSFLRLPVGLKRDTPAPFNLFCQSTHSCHPNNSTCQIRKNRLQMQL
jgi:hypothetical protein